MLGRLTGILAEKSPPQLLIDVNGVGYEVDVPMSSFYNLPGLGERVTLLTHFVVREDAQVLYGFLTHEERAAFRQLVKISGVGPRTALAILSGLSVSELTQAVSRQESARLVKVPGIAMRWLPLRRPQRMRKATSCRPCWHWVTTIAKPQQR
jgi:Holliday junction DNA helicase RuvA